MDASTIAIHKAFKSANPSALFDALTSSSVDKEDVLSALRKLDIHKNPGRKGIELTSHQVACYKALATSFDAKTVLFEIADYPILANAEAIKKLLVSVKRKDKDLVVDRFFKLVLAGNFELARLVFKWIQRVDETAEADFGSLFNYISTLSDAEKCKIVLFSCCL